MRKTIISLFLCSCLAPATLLAQDQKPQQPAPVQLQEKVPDRYVVAKGDTLWSVAAKFLKQPWQWPALWGMNKDAIRNPHLIYPGDVLVLDMVDGQPTLRKLDSGKPGVVKLRPEVRVLAREKEAIPSIPPSVIQPFLTQPLVVEYDGLDEKPYLVATRDGRVALGVSDIGYAYGVTENKGLLWNVFRPGPKFVDPESEEILGLEATYLGDARVNIFGDPSTVEIVRSVREINKGDRLLPIEQERFFTYVPHAPEKAVKGKILTVYDGVNESGRSQVVSISKGSRDGLEVGHVLAIYRDGATAKLDQDREKYPYERDVAHAYPIYNWDTKTVKLPNERIGLLFVFRTFEKVSYGLIVQSSRAVNKLDLVQNP